MIVKVSPTSDKSYKDILKRAEDYSMVLPFHGFSSMHNELQIGVLCDAFDKLGDELIFDTDDGRQLVILDKEWDDYAVVNGNDDEALTDGYWKLRKKDRHNRAYQVKLVGDNNKVLVQDAVSKDTKWYTSSDFAELFVRGDENG